VELWAGIECTLNRVGDRWLDQLALSGHDRRLSDLDELAAVGVRTVRYPVLWERTDDWSWPDERLGRLRELGIRPIVGLVHHGSGPADTSLLDPGFPQKLGAYARRVAARYPWVTDWTPVNEPLTTARFSALYGHWYPHARDDRSFGRALENELRAVVLAMRAVRDVNPHARLVQTEDIGRIHATPRLAYQAAFDNERRWLTYDLLCGRSNATARHYGIDAAWFAANPCPPDVLGVNHYLSGERLLDESLPGPGNGREPYGDEMVPNELRVGPEAILRDVRERYGLPIAVTEAHNCCTREEQLRWLDDVWHAAHAVEGVKAVTVWSWLGVYGWDTLATGGETYGSGVYDARSDPPRPTALAAMSRDLSADRAHRHPVLESPGWWRRGGCAVGPPLVVTGATGTLGRAVGDASEGRGLAYRLLRREELEIADEASVAHALDRHRPWAVVNTAGYVRVDDAEEDAARCFRENRDGARVLAEACAERGLPLVTFSSDLVFDGRRAVPYVEDDAAAPLNVYGRSKAEAERLVLDAWPAALVVRTSAFFGPSDRWNFLTVALQRMAAGETVDADGESIVSPTYVPDLVRASLDLLIDGERGVWHLANAGETTWAGLARLGAGATGVSPRVRPTRPPSLRAARPRYSALGSARAVLLPELEDAVARYARERVA